MFALIDGNNFYASCERAFNPGLENKPIVILSNNDGCIIARSNEAKKLGIPMGAPYYQWKKLCAKEQVHVFSSNYELYGDMSQRVMSLINAFNPDMEIYSIDEAFLHLSHASSLQEMLDLKNHIKMCTGIPVSIGVGMTKTLAKAANQLAKTMSPDGIFFLDDPAALALLPVEKIWGIGRRLAVRLNALNIDTAQQLRDSDAKFMRLHFNVVIEKTIQELKGISCLGMEQFQPRKQIISSRSFGKPVMDIVELEEAVSHYMTIAAHKLRGQKSLASAVHVFVQTNRFNNKPQYANGITCSLVAPSADTRELIHLAKQGLHKIYRKNYQYNKAGVILMDISSQDIQQYDLFQETAVKEKSEKLMQVLDKVNKCMGRRTVFFAAEGIKRAWLIKCSNKSPCYTTRWTELPVVF